MSIGSFIEAISKVMENCQQGQKTILQARPIDYVDSLRSSRKVNDDSFDSIASAINDLIKEVREIEKNPPVIVSVDEKKETDKAIDELVDAFVGKPNEV